MHSFTFVFIKENGFKEIKENFPFKFMHFDPIKQWSIDTFRI